MLGSGAEQGEPTGGVKPQGAPSRVFPWKYLLQGFFCILALDPCFSGLIFLGCECAPSGEWGGVRIRPLSVPVLVQTQKR